MSLTCDQGYFWKVHLFHNTEKNCKPNLNFRLTNFFASIILENVKRLIKIIVSIALSKSLTVVTNNDRQKNVEVFIA